MSVVKHSHTTAVLKSVHWPKLLTTWNINFFLSHTRSSQLPSITRTLSFQPLKLVNMQFICTKITRRQREIMLCEMLSELSQHEPPLSCEVSINVTSECGHGDVITLSHNYLISVISSTDSELSDCIFSHFGYQR